MAGKHRDVKRTVKIVNTRTGRTIRGTLAGKIIRITRSMPFKELNRKVAGDLEILNQPSPNFVLTENQQTTLSNINKRMQQGTLRDFDLRKVQEIKKKIEYNIKTRKNPPKTR